MVTGIISCSDNSVQKTFLHCEAESSRFANAYEVFTFSNTCKFPWHENIWADAFILKHIDSNRYTLTFRGTIVPISESVLKLEIVRDGCNFTIIEQEVEIAELVYIFSGSGYHAELEAPDAPSDWQRLSFDFTYVHEGIVFNCSISGSKT